MRIRVINKNNDKLYQVDEGSVIIENKDETLDQATVLISNQQEKIDLEPLDLVILIDETQRMKTKVLSIDTFTCTETGLVPKIYKYEIRLVSQTKEIEGIILPSLKITKMEGRSISIWEYMNQYLREYSPYIRVGVSKDNYSFQKKYTLDTEFESIFSDECPEMQWNTPTLREVLNSLAMIKDHIIVVSNNKISFVDLTSTFLPTEEALSCINYIQRSQSLQDYVIDLRVNLVNVTNDQSQNTNNFVTRTEWCSITGDSALLTEENFYLETDYPIYKIKSFHMMFPASMLFSSPGESTNRRFSRWVSVDLLNCTLGDVLGNLYPDQKMLVESKEWQVLDVKYQDWAAFPVSQYSQYKNAVLRYTRGGNRIEGFNEKTKIAFWTEYQLTYLKLALARGILPISFMESEGGLVKYWTSVPTISQNIEVDPWYMTFFKIEYETIAGCVFEAGKGIAPSHTRVVTDNQSNSYINSYSQGALEYMKANRLGNLQKHINATYRNNEYQDDMIKLGDIIDGSIVYQCQYQIYRNHIELNAIATEDYVLRNYYTGVRAKLRSWKIADGSEALTRNDLSKYYLEFSFRTKLEKYGLSVLTENNLPEYFLSPFVDSNSFDPIKYCFVRTFDSDGNSYPASGSGQNNYYALDLQSRIIGNSFVFTFQFRDNYWASKYIEITADQLYTQNGENYKIQSGALIQNSGVPTQHYRYTDLNGENQGGLVLLGPTMQFYDVKTFNTSAEDTESAQWIAQAFGMPLIDITEFEDSIKVSLPFNNRKDSQEITALSIQFELCRDTKNISFTRRFLERQEITRTIANIITPKVYVSDSSTYNHQQPSIPGDAIGQSAVLSVIPAANNLSAQLKITWQEQDLEDKAIYIADDSNLLLAINNVPEENISIAGGYVTVTVFLNILRTRDYNVYSLVDNLEVIDTI